MAAPLSSQPLGGSTEVKITPGLCSGALLVRDDKILLGRRSPAEKHFPNAWDLIGGNAKPSETPGETMVRETEEEIGAIPTEYSLLDIVSAPDPEDGAFRTYYIYLVSAWAGPDPYIKNQEHAELGWFTLAEARKLALAHSVYLDLFGKVEVVFKHGAA